MAYIGFLMASEVFLKTLNWSSSNFHMKILIATFSLE